MITAELVSAAAAVLSAAASVFSIRAAFRSADSAHAAQRSVEEAARRNALLNVARTAADVLAEFQRVEYRSKQAKTGYDMLLMFSGSCQHTGIDEGKTNVSLLRAQAQELAEYARLWADPGAKLRNTPPEEIDRVQLKLSANLGDIGAVLEELDRTVASVEAQKAPFVQRALSKVSK